MANCPNCGSSDIQLKTDSRQNVNWGRAIAGWALFGVVGGAVGSVTGKGTSNTITANVCLNCGTIWDAATLYKLLQYIESVTTVELNLSLKKDRDRMNIFINEIQPLIDKVKAIQISTNLTLSRQNKRNSLITGLILFSWGSAVLVYISNRLRQGFSLEGSDRFMAWCSVGLIGVGILFIGISTATASDAMTTKKIKDADYKLELEQKIAKFIADTY